ncbi:hypothetical protein LCGC14_2723780, partial [marine sediment metagenome]
MVYAMNELIVQLYDKIKILEKK